MRWMVTPLLLFSLVGPALASDGVLEINQACAANTGCFSGDTGGFPVTITAPGSYRLTSNLDVSPDPNVDGIQVTADGVTIDLSGFEIAGPVTCTGLGSEVACSAGTGYGINANSATGVTVRGGRVTGFAFGGVRLSGRGLVDTMLVEANGGDGIRTEANSIVRGSTAYRNGATGIQISFGSIVEHCVSASNRSVGISASGASITANAANDNGGHGISGSTAAISHNSTTFNEGDGIFATSSNVSDNVSISNLGDGIEASFGSNVQRNGVRGNTNFGLNLGSQTGYRENTITFDTINGGVNMGANLCGTTPCP